MGFFDCIWEPESFLGFTDLKTGALILGLLSLVFALIAILDSKEHKAQHYICSLVPIVFSILFVVGIINNKENLVHIYNIYCCICFIFQVILISILLFFSVICSIFVLEKYKFTKSIAWVIFFVVYLLVSLYTWRVVNAYNKEMKGK